MASFSLTREAVIAADLATVHGLIDDFHAWKEWSPWEEMDPDLERTYAGPEKGVGARYSWSGNKKVGTGCMEITASSPEEIDIDLEFVEPFKARNTSVFRLTPTDGGTRVAWTMAGERNVVMTLLGKLFFDKAIAKDFDKGLAKLDAAARARA